MQRGVHLALHMITIIIIITMNNKGVGMAAGVNSHLTYVDQINFSAAVNQQLRQLQAPVACSDMQAGILNGLLNTRAGS